MIRLTLKIQITFYCGVYCSGDCSLCIYLKHWYGLASVLKQVWAYNEIRSSPQLLDLTKPVSSLYSYMYIKWIYNPNNVSVSCYTEDIFYNKKMLFSENWIIKSYTILSNKKNLTRALGVSELSESRVVCFGFLATGRAADDDACLRFVWQHKKHVAGSNKWKYKVAIMKQEKAPTAQPVYKKRWRMDWWKASKQNCTFGVETFVLKNSNHECEIHYTHGKERWGLKFVSLNNNTNLKSINIDWTFL